MPKPDVAIDPLDRAYCPYCLGVLRKHTRRRCSTCSMETGEVPWRTMRDMLSGADMGSPWNDVSLGDFARLVARLAIDDPEAVRAALETASHDEA